MEQTSATETWRVAPGVSFRSGTTPRSTEIAGAPGMRKLEYRRKSSPTTAAVNNVRQRYAAARLAEVKRKNCRHEPASGLAVSSANRALSSARGPAIGGNWESRDWR